MRTLLAKAQRWWKLRRRRPGTPSPYTVPCRCGVVLSGMRQAQFQRLRCSACGRLVFVLPYSPLPPVAPPDGVPASPSLVPPATAGRRRLARPLLVGGLLAAVLLLGGVLLGSRILHEEPVVPAAAANVLETIRKRVAEGRKSLGAGNFQVAHEKLAEARALAQQHEQSLPPSESRQLTHLYRQAALLADLSSEALAEILALAAGVPDAQEWEAAFAHRYRGKAVVFDGEVRRDSLGRHHLDYQVSTGNAAAVVEINDLKFLDELPLMQPQRLLFGCRLASTRREPPGKWVIRFEPDSGVLLTEPGENGAGCFQTLGLDYTDVIERQNAWLGGAPMGR